MKTFKKIKKLLKQVRYKLEAFWYWFLCHTYTRYHIVDCRSKEFSYSWGYQEPSDLIELACWNLLIQFVEKNQPFGEVPGLYKNEYCQYHWNEDPELTLENIKKSHNTDNDEWANDLLKGYQQQHAIGQQIKELYLWIKFERAVAYDDCEKLLDTWYWDHPSDSLFKEGCDTLDTSCYDDPRWKAYYLKDQELHNKDQEMLEKLIKLHRHFWT